MATFESIFPTFLSKCAELHALMQAVAFALFVVGLTATVGHGITKRQIFRYIIRLTVLTSLLVFLPQWGNALQDLLKDAILSGLGVDPADVYRQYQQLVQSKQPDASDSAWWDIVSRVQSAVVESFISAVLWLVGHIAAWLLWWAYVFQKIILHLGYALSPVLIGFMAIQGLKHTGGRYLLNLTGVLLWPLGWAIAALVTQAILDFMTDPTFKVLDPTGGFYTLQNQFGAAVLGFWIIFSTFAAPIVIQKVFLYGALAGSELLTSAVRTAVHAATAAVGGAVAAAPYRSPLVTTAAIGTAGAFTALSTASEVGYAGSIVVAATGLGSRGGRDRDDITGERAVRRMLAQTREQFAEPISPLPQSTTPMPRKR